jgi:hypothetical protein
MTMTDERFDATAYAAQVKALRAKFYPAKAPCRHPARAAAHRRDHPPDLRKHAAPVGVVMARVYGPFPLAPVFQAFVEPVTEKPNPGTTLSQQSHASTASALPR